MAIASIDTRLEVRPATALIGAEIRGLDLRRSLDPQTVRFLRSALLEWKVLFFRDQDITQEQQIAFGEYFGEVTSAHPTAEALPDHPEIWERHAADYRKRIKDLSAPTAQAPRRDSQGWHIDITFVANPALGSILRGIDIPPYGGDTVWSNLVAAYEGLSPKIQELIDGLQAVHRAGGYDQADNKERAVYTSLHPLVRVHPETGRKALFVNPGVTTHIVGLKERESTALLDVLVEEIKRPEYQVRFHWERNSIAFWDNRVTAHVGPVDYAFFDAPRVVQRITIAGDLPQGPDGFRSRPLEGELFR